ncbi:hypothetical protein RQM47_10175 [Rubrivirga sp. S365]|uniref:Uncharacterized protein n=1 Tax=Rubrivirga litoralis TaxID=3075598 RepID=A0ABU3BTD3_9BACT|nr:MULTISPECIES: hypothetical protein [unclassified Rubrivirga]MDT0632542.1 hypothetical protein [Rubrivirga sp. F394]MDT7857007.1 hypothetical protein [Rubrivirga sp. S365]
MLVLAALLAAAAGGATATAVLVTLCRLAGPDPIAEPEPEDAAFA